MPFAGKLHLGYIFDKINNKNEFVDSIFFSEIDRSIARSESGQRNRCAHKCTQFMIYDLLLHLKHIGIFKCDGVVVNHSIIQTIAAGCAYNLLPLIQSANKLKMLTHLIDDVIPYWRRFVPADGRCYANRTSQIPLQMILDKKKFTLKITHDLLKDCKKNERKKRNGCLKLRKSTASWHPGSSMTFSVKEYLRVVLVGEFRFLLWQRRRKRKFEASIEKKVLTL